MVFVLKLSIHRKRNGNFWLCIKMSKWNCYCLQMLRIDEGYEEHLNILPRIFFPVCFLFYNASGKLIKYSSNWGMISRFLISVLSCISLFFPLLVRYFLKHDINIYMLIAFDYIWCVTEASPTCDDSTKISFRPAAPSSLWGLTCTLFSIT